MIGKVINNLRIESMIGQGGMGEVYLAEHIKLGNKFAVKCLAPELTRSPQFKERFFKEARTLASLSHANIVRVIDFQEEEQFYLVMEYVPGKRLDELIGEKGRLEEREALLIFKQVMQGLNYAHGKGVIHRDIKPSNIKITPEGEVKIMDFGIALMVGDKRLTRTGTTIGTPEYMSPEQIVSPKEIDHRSDIYSAGIMLYEMLTGDVPFTTDTDSDYKVKDQQVNAAPPDPRSKNPRISLTLAQIVLKALEKKPDQRYTTCGEFLRIIEAYEKGEGEDSKPFVAETEKRTKPVEEKKPAAQEKVLKKKISKWGVLVLLAGVFIIFAVGLIWLEGQQLDKAAERALIEERESQSIAEAVRLDDSAYQQAVNVNNKAGYLEYLRLYPRGRHAVEAGAKVREIEEREATRQKNEEARRAEEMKQAVERDDKAYAEAERTNTDESYRSYLSRFSGGRHEAEAKSKLIEIEQREEARRAEESRKAEESRRQEEAARAERERREQFISSLGIRIVRIPGGSFMMGSEDGESDEKPVHRVTISGFEISATEITQAQYESVMGTNPSYFRGENLPVEQVSWNEAMEFCRRLSERSGQTFDLPTEAEWEYACRAGSITRYYTGDSEGGLGRAGWYSGNSGNITHPVGQKAPNAFGLYDMHGNVWEWCKDWYGDSYYNQSSSQNPSGPGSGSPRVSRGGSWGANANGCRSAGRLDSPGSGSYPVGFRVIRR